MGQPFAPQTRPIVQCEYCDRPAYAHDLCYTHHERARRGYRLEGRIRSPGLTDAEKVDAILGDARRDGECIIASRIGAQGYATDVKDEQGRQTKTHRLVYRVKVGPIPDGEQVHHTCGKRACINPKHLVAATQRENVGEMLARLSYKRQVEALLRENKRLRRELAKLRRECQ